MIQLAEVDKQSGVSNPAILAELAEKLGESWFPANPKVPYPFRAKDGFSLL